MNLSRQSQVEKAAVFLTVIIMYASKMNVTARILDGNHPSTFSADISNDKSQNPVNLKWNEITASRRRARSPRGFRIVFETSRNRGNDFTDIFLRAANGSELGQVKPNTTSTGSPEPNKSGLLNTTVVGSSQPGSGQESTETLPGSTTTAQTWNRRATTPKPVSFGQFNFKYNLKPSPVCRHKITPTPTSPTGANKTTQVTEVSEQTTTVPPPPEEPYISLTLKQKENILKAHNKYRSTVKPTAADMRILTWDDELAWISETYTNSCYYRDLVEPRLYNADGSAVLREVDLKRHSYYLSEVGHNWFAWVGENALPDGFEEESVAIWTSENDLFDLVTSECNGVCHHYLQVVWAETFKLGCSASWCEEPNINGVIWPPALLFVCSYTPRGGVANFMAANSPFSFFQPKLTIPPYTVGVPCSVCVVESKPGDKTAISDKCWNDLCTNDVRDRKTPFVPPPVTTTYPWIRIPTKSTTTATPITESSIPSNKTEEIDIQIDDDLTVIVESGGKRNTFIDLTSVLFSVILSFVIVSTFSDDNRNS